MISWAAMKGRRAARALAALLLGGCLGPPIQEEKGWAEKLHAPKEEERVEAFQWLLRRGDRAAPALKRVLHQGPRHGYPAAALLYALGEGDAVPPDVRARHLVAFRWPAAHDAENAVVEAYAWREIERDFLRDGRSSIRLLAAALERDAVGEEKAVAAARVLLGMGRREVGDALAALLDAERDLGGVRVADVAAAALLFLGNQEALLRLASPEQRRAGARAWWERARDQPEAEWWRTAVAALAERARPRDPEAVRGALELLTGEAIDDAVAWAERNRDWKPPAPPLRPEELLGELQGPRPRVFRANLLLEQATGLRVWLPPMRSLGELVAALRLWRPPEDLAIRWKRRLEGTLLRLSVSAVGYHPQKNANAVLWNRDTYFRAHEEAADEFRLGRVETYSLYVQACSLGTRLVVNEFGGRVEAGLASVEEASALRPFVLFSPLLKACVLVEVAEAPAARPPRGPEEVTADLRRSLREAAAALPDGLDRRRLLRALGYFQEKEDLEFLRERKAGEALLLHGDPAALELEPRLAPHEAEMGLRRAADARVREYLERLQAGR